MFVLRTTLSLRAAFGSGETRACAKPNDIHNDSQSDNTLVVVGRSRRELSVIIIIRALK